jgi:hypothetical protein
VAAKGGKANAKQESSKKRPAPSTSTSKLEKKVAPQVGKTKAADKTKAKKK